MIIRDFAQSLTMEEYNNVKALEGYSTRVLSLALERREGVKTIIAGPEENVELSEPGPAVVLVVID